MDKIKVHDKCFRPFLRNSEILAATAEVAKRLSRDYADSPQPIVLLCVLKGAIPFTAALMQCLDNEAELACIKVSSYEGMNQSGSVNVGYCSHSDFSGRDVIICEDIVDTGLTIRRLKEYLLEKGARSVKTCCMLLKPAKFEARLVRDNIIPAEHTPDMVRKFAPEYYAMEIPDDFVVGFGLDYDEYGRSYKDIYTLCEE